MREVTQGMLDRFQRRYDSLGYQQPLNMLGMGRRAQLKALRDAMCLTRNQLRRMMEKR